MSLTIAAGEGRNVYVIRGKQRECVFQFDRFADLMRGGPRAVMHVDERKISFPGGGAVHFVTLADVQAGRLRGVDNPLVAASAYYHPHELDQHLPDPHDRVEWC